MSLPSASRSRYLALAIVVLVVSLSLLLRWGDAGRPLALEPGVLRVVAESPRDFELSAPGQVAREAPVEDVHDSLARISSLWRELRRSRRYGPRPSKIAVLMELGLLAQRGEEAAVDRLARWLVNPDYRLGGGRAGANGRPVQFAQAVGELSDPRFGVAARRACLALMGIEGRVAEGGEYLPLVARHGGREGAAFLLELLDGLDAPMQLSAATALAASPNRELNGVWLQRLVETQDEKTAVALSSSLISWDEEGVDSSMRGLVHAPYVDEERRGMLARRLATSASPDVALSLVTPFWTTRDSPENALHVAAAGAVVHNQRVSREDLERVVLPVLEQLILDKGRRLIDRKRVLDLLSSPRMTSERTLELLIRERGALAKGGLRRPVKRSIQGMKRTLRRERRELLALAEEEAQLARRARSTQDPDQLPE